MGQKDLELSLLLKMVDRMTDPAKRVTGVTGKLAKRLGETKTAISKLNQQSKKIGALQQLNTRLGKTSSSLDQAKKRLALLHKEFNQKGPSKRLQRQIENAQKKVRGLSEKHKTLKISVTKSRTALRKSGIDTRNLSSAQEQLSRRTGRLNKKLQRQAWAMRMTGRAGAKLRAGMAKLRTAALWGGGAALAGGIAIGMPLLNTASEFENYQATLKTIEGSQAKAKKSMDWISEFANKTPFKIGQVTSSFVKMRAYGLDPTSGMLKTLGNTGSAMGKPVMQAVEAMADAITGENERLKEFGIKAKAQGDMFVYSYTDNKGVQRELSALKNDRKGIEKVLRKIWDNKFAGAMEDRMKTWGGLMSNMSDKWTRFQLLIMNSGPLNKLKENLTGVLAKFDSMEKSGQLQKWAESIGQKITYAIDGLTAFGAKVWGIMQTLREFATPIAEFVGGWDNLALTLLSLKLLPTITMMGMLFIGVTKLIGGVSGLKAGFKGVGKTLKWLRVMALAHPIIALLSAIGVGAYLVVKNWDAIKSAFSSALNWIISYMPNWMKGMLGISDKGTSTADAVKKSQSVSSPKKALAAAAITASLATGSAVAAPVVTSSNSAASAVYQVAINIHTQPGDDKQAIAEQIRDVLEDLHRDKQSRRSVTLYDS